MMKQSDAVVLVVRSVHPEGVVPPTGEWSETQRTEVYNTLLGMFKRGEWSKTSGGNDDASVMKYIPGLVNNHVRKDKRLNGGVKYVPKNPCSRKGSGDESVKAMRQLLSVTSDPAIKVQIEEAIAFRLEEIKPKVVIDVEALPEALRHLVG